jgi:hypothetical protein
MSESGTCRVGKGAFAAACETRRRQRVVPTIWLRAVRETVGTLAPSLFELRRTSRFAHRTFLFAAILRDAAARLLRMRSFFVARPSW